MRLTFLCDNTAAPGLGAEWGLCVAVEPEDGSFWLWDTGQSKLFLDNAARLGIRPQDATGVVFSHGHYDHTGGLAALRSAGFQGRTVAHEQAEAVRYSHSKNIREIGPPAPLAPFEAVRNTTALAPGLTMFTDIPRRPGLFQAVQGFSYDPEGNRPDPVPDDAFLLLETKKGPVVLLGCCHSGLENSLAHLRETLGIEQLHAVVGGLHLYAQEQPEWEHAARILEDFSVELLAVGHCTGEKAARYLKERLGCDVLDTHSGLVLDF